MTWGDQLLDLDIIGLVLVRCGMDSGQAPGAWNRKSSGFSIHEVLIVLPAIAGPTGSSSALTEAEFRRSALCMYEG